MWLDKVAKTESLKRYFFEEFLDMFGYNQVRIVGKDQIDNSTAYVVKANYYVKDLECTFYFSDYSVMTDLMNNPSYRLKQNNFCIDRQWAILVSSHLSKEDSREYKKEFKERVRNRLKEERDFTTHL